MPKGGMPWYCTIFSIPGFIIGGSIGFVSAGLIGILRVIVNSYESGIRAFVSATNLVLKSENQISEDQVEGLEKDFRPWYLKYALGFPGIVLGGLVGTVGFATVGLARICFNSLATAKRQSSALSKILYKIFDRASTNADNLIIFA